MPQDCHTTASSLTSCQWGEPTKLVSAFGKKKEKTEEPQQQQGYPSTAYPSMMPMAPGPGMPQMMYMMPSNCGPMSPSNYHKGMNTGRGSSSYGSHSGGPSQHELNGTFESVTSFDSAICAKPCEGVGRFFGKTVNGFLNGCTSVLDCGENSCSLNNLVRDFIANGTIGTNIPTEMIASTPHPQPENESLTEKMDELLKLLKDKESSVGSVSRSESSGIVAHSPQDLKTKAKKAPINDIGDQADQLIEMFKKMNPNNNFNGLNESIEMLKNINPINNFSGLNESAISKVSEMISIGQDLVLDPTVDFETDAKPPPDATLTPTNSLLDEISFELSLKGMDTSITGEVGPKPEKKGDVKPSGRPPLPIASVASAKKMNDATEKENKARSQIDSDAPTTKTIKAQANMKMKSFRGRRVKKMLKDIKNVPKMNKNASKKARAVNITVEDHRNSCSEKNSVDREPFAANFSSEAAVDSMGFPLSSTQSDDKNKKGSSWEKNFTCKDNPFPGKDRVDASSEARICEWCRKGGTTDAEIVKKLKLCSRCQATYYCSPECQSKDWINGHAKTCQPNSVAMY